MRIEPPGVARVAVLVDTHAVLVLRLDLDRDRPFPPVRGHPKFRATSSPPPIARLTTLFSMFFTHSRRAPRARAIEVRTARLAAR